MILLAIDTSSPVLSVALKKNKEETLEKFVGGFFNHAENLMPVIAGLLKKNRLQLQDVNAFLIDRGPGSFTGLRIGLAAMKGFLAAGKKKCFGALSLDLISENVPIRILGPSSPVILSGAKNLVSTKSEILRHKTPQDDRKNSEAPWLAVALDAYREKIYFGLYKRRKARWAPYRKPQTVSLDELKKLLPEHTVITGDALGRYHNLFEVEMSDKQNTCLSQKYWHPKASALISFFLKKDPRLVPLKTPRDFVPLYFRLSEAEERRKVYARAH